ncbi:MULTISPECIES: hypothetical protein [unclassified Bradyrhizobium]|uniref:hypothetical protein n=1 Tax=unclassified Bradyrhizobium TaxID=2631580 RepID=UPI001FFC16CD|nr:MULTISPECIES: hypothetical protein [unclassified Bradyrhizobium]
MTALCFPEPLQDFGPERLNFPAGHANIEQQLLCRRRERVIAIVEHFVMHNEALSVELEDARGDRQCATGKNFADVGDVEITCKYRMASLKIGIAQAQVAAGEVAGLGKYLEIRPDIHMPVHI